LGIDVHKTTYSVAAVCEKVVVKKATLPADPEGLVAFCRKFFPGALIQSAYEAGFSGFSLHRILEKNSIKNIVIHPSGLEMAVGNRVKTDKRDALKIASHLEANRLKGIHVPTQELEEKRAVTRIRNSISEHKVSIGNQIKSFLHHHGLFHLVAKQKISPRWIEALKKQPMKEELRFALDQLINMWQECQVKIKQCDVRMKKQALEEHRLEAVYCSTPGIGPVAARVLANELEDMSRFSNERQLFSYLGLTPSEHSSGEFIRKGHISRQGKPLLRKMLVLAAWKAVRSNESLCRVFERISMKAGGKRAIVAIARRLIGHIRACFRKQCLYEQVSTLAAQPG
jgi:transposase